VKDGIGPAEAIGLLKEIDPGEDVLFKEKILITTTDQIDPGWRLIWQETGLSEPPNFVSFFPTIGTPYGFEFSLDQGSGGQRSTQSVNQPFYDTADQLLGYVEVSNGPAYGRQVLQRVAQGWAIASSVAVVVAAVVGWFVSHRLTTPLLTLTEVTTQMAAGDLSARVEVFRRDEVGLLAGRFNEMAQQVEETVATLRRFVADAAHELHTPLTALRTNLELAIEDRVEQQQTHLEQAQLQVIRLEQLSRDLLDLSRLETETGKINHKPVDLIRLLQEIGERYASQAEQAHLSFTLQLPEERLTVSGNEAHLRRAVSNLLDNALKFTQAGGVVQMALSHLADTEEVEIQIEDSGIGIPPDELPQLFSRFHRGRNATTYPGNGLGLAIVKAIVEGHGGRVTAENTAQGARFSLYLPVS
jgi:signal transduction histidine kinase